MVLFCRFQMWLHMLVAIVAVAIFNWYTPYAAALPAFAVVVIIAVPSIFCFLASINFVFWCRRAAR